jgi:hypothetical protein
MRRVISLGLLLLITLTANARFPVFVRGVTILEFKEDEVSVTKDHEKLIAAIFDQLLKCGPAPRAGSLFYLNSGMQLKDRSRDLNILGARAYAVSDFLVANGAREEMIGIQIYPRPRHGLPLLKQVEQYVEIQWSCRMPP